METNRQETIPQGYKATALGVIPQEWEILDFDEIVEKSKDRYTPNPDTHLYCIELEHLSQGEGTLIGYTDSAEQKSTKNRFQKGDVLFGKLRPYLQKYWLATFDGVCSTEIWVFHAMPNICLKEYLFQVISSYNFIQQANVSSGSKMPRAEWDYVSKIPILVPPLGEQRKIAEVLGVWDLAIAKQVQLVERLTERKRALMQRLLTAKLRLPGFSTPWKKVKLGDVAELYQPQTIQSEDLLQTGYPVYGANGFIGYYSSYNHEHSQVVITCRGSSCGAVNFTPEKCWITGNAMVLNVDNNRDVNKSFFYYLISNSSFINLISGSGQPQIVRRPLLKFELHIPPLDEQTAIAEVLTAADREIELAQAKLELYRRQKRGLMQQLLTGKKRIKF